MRLKDEESACWRVRYARAGITVYNNPFRSLSQSETMRVSQELEMRQLWAIDFSLVTLNGSCVTDWVGVLRLRGRWRTRCAQDDTSKTNARARTKAKTTTPPEQLRLGWGTLRVVLQVSFDGATQIMWRGSCIIPPS